MKRVAIYIRVSTSKQDTDNQRRELEAVAERSGWKVVKVYEDAGVSGAKGRDQRPGLDAMMKAVNAKEFDMVASWSVDRLGRSLTDLLSILQSLHEKGVGHSFTNKDSTPRRPRAKRCFRCLAYSLSSSGGSFGNESTPGLLARGQTARSWADPGSSLR
jgi:DNA invertase Pin-like site-specific DNA recombinase